MIVEVVLLIITEIVKVVTAATVLVTTESTTAATRAIPGATTERITIGKITTVTTATDRRMTTETTIGENETTCSCNFYKSFTPRHIRTGKRNIFLLPGTEITVTVTWKGSGSLKITMTVVLPKSFVLRTRDRGLEWAQFHRWSITDPGSHHLVVTWQTSYWKFSMKWRSCWRNEYRDQISLLYQCLFHMPVKKCHFSMWQCDWWLIAATHMVLLWMHRDLYARQILKVKYVFITQSNIKNESL